MTAAALDEEDLLVRARAGDEFAFAELVHASRHRVWAVCFRITGSHHDAEDAVQEAMTAAWTNLGAFRGGSAFSTWLYRIATNAALAVVRRRREEPVDELPERADPRDVGEHLVENDRVQRALAQLPPDFRAALVMRAFADMTYEDIAAAQGVNIQTVKSRLNRARHAVRSLLAED